MSRLGRLVAAILVGAAAVAIPLAPAHAATTGPAYVQGTAFATGARQTSLAVSLGAVTGGDLLVGWFAQYNASGQVSVSDNVNGAWTRAGGIPFNNGTGDIALYYVANSAAAPSGITVTASAGAAAYFQGALAEYRGVAGLDAYATGSGSGTAAATASTTAVGAGDLVYSAVVTGGSPGTVTPGSGDTARAQTSSGSAYEQDNPNATAGPQQGSATLGAATDWYAVVAAFTPARVSPPSAPHVMEILMENHPIDEIIGNPDAPYINSLADTYGMATNWSSMTDISLPNYLALSAGSVQGDPQDTTPAQQTYPGPTFVDELAQAGISWKAYIEDMPTPCDQVDTFSPGYYDVNHNPWLYYDSIRNNPAQCANDVPGTQFATDLAANNLPSFVWYTPNRLHDMHDGTVAQGDTFLSQLIPQVLNSQWYGQGGIILLTWDEGTSTDPLVATIAISAKTPPGARETTAGNQYGTLRTLEELYGVGYLGASAGGADLMPLLGLPHFVQGSASSPGTRALSATASFSQPVAQGDLLAGWFAQYDTGGPVTVADNVNGAWTRSSFEHFTNGLGDIALYYLPNARAAPNGLTITASAAAPAYLPMAVGDYSGVASSGALVATSVAEGTGSTADSGSTAAVGWGQLVIGALLTGGQPDTITSGTSENVPYTLNVGSDSDSADLLSIDAGAAGTQHATFTLPITTDWYALCAVFRPGP
ncbi:MAG TPA: alkaline phosphatase family protein [Pseudonocardiaceae bacterium]|nr:alkaline phosphatase family protein [Pseudonocardiaceae bacterium]